MWYEKGKNYNPLSIKCVFNETVVVVKRDLVSVCERGEERNVLEAVYQTQNRFCKVHKSRSNLKLLRLLASFISSILSLL